jgi:hypothetical protein
LVQGILRQQPAANAHPLAATPERIDGEAIARELDQAEKELLEPKPSLASLARLREQIGRLADQSAWVMDEKARRHLLERTASLLEKIDS